MISPYYRFEHVTLVRIVDGDTVELDFDLGFKVRSKQLCRLYGVNTPELPTTEGLAAKEWTGNWLSERRFIAETYKSPEKYGRWLVRILDAADESVCLNDELVATGHAAPYVL
jgi:endonuclease YncB( thermonuclease family)